MVGAGTPASLIEAEGGDAIVAGGVGRVVERHVRGYSGEMTTRIPSSAAAVCVLSLLAGCSGSGGSAIPSTGTQGGTQGDTLSGKQAELDAFLLEVHTLQAASLVRYKAVQRATNGYFHRANTTKALPQTQAALVVKAGAQEQAVSRRISTVVAPVALKAAWARHARAVWADGQAMKSLGRAGNRARDARLFGGDYYRDRWQRSVRA